MNIPAGSTPARGGFTLVEVLVSLTIVGVIAAVATPMVIASMKREKEAELRSALRQIRQAIDDYRDAVDQGRVALMPGQSRYPPTLGVLELGVTDALDPARRRIYFLRRVPRDPFAPNPDAAAADTWGLRSHASPPEAPAPGADVFDVYSRSEAVGTNGVPYRQW